MDIAVHVQLLGKLDFQGINLEVQIHQNRGNIYFVKKTLYNVLFLFSFTQKFHKWEL